ncbi:unnamed protein product [Boreogadus saida]
MKSKSFQLATQSSRQHADSLPRIPEALYARTEPGATGPPAGYAKSAAPPPTERLDPLLNHHRKTDDTRLKHYFVHLSTTKYSQENTDCCSLLTRGSERRMKVKVKYFGRGGHLNRLLGGQQKAVPNPEWDPLWLGTRCEGNRSHRGCS